LLIAYGTKTGATRATAEVIVRILRKRGLEAEVRPATEIDDLTSVDGVVFSDAAESTNRPSSSSTPSASDDLDWGAIEVWADQLARSSNRRRAAAAPS
jgi:hypothetical protein